MWLLALLACAPKVTKIAPDILPVLPSPVAPSYAHVVAIPRDPLVALVMAGEPWEASLAGGATGVAMAILAKEPVGPRLVAWKAALAGYPWPVDVAEQARARPGEPPETLAKRARELAAEPGRDVGLVRARSGEEDVWVLLSARRRARLPEVPRTLHVGDSLPEWGVDATIFSPADGAARSLPLVLDQPGEWMAEVRVGGERVARFPLHVGVDAPQVPPIGDGPGTGELGEQGGLVIDTLRARYGQDRVVADPMLESVARALLRRAHAGTLGDVVGAMQAAGFVDMPVAGATCVGRDVAACLDQVWWSGSERSVLVGGFLHVAIAGESTPEGVRLVVLGAG